MNDPVRIPHHTVPYRTVPYNGFGRFRSVPSIVARSIGGFVCVVAVCFSFSFPSIQFACLSLLKGIVLYCLVLSSSLVFIRLEVRSYWRQTLFHRKHHRKIPQLEIISIASRSVISMTGLQEKIILWKVLIRRGIDSSVTRRFDFVLQY